MRIELIKNVGDDINVLIIKIFIFAMSTSIHTFTEIGGQADVTQNVLSSKGITISGFI